MKVQYKISTIRPGSVKNKSLSVKYEVQHYPNGYDSDDNAQVHIEPDTYAVFHLGRVIDEYVGWKSLKEHFIIDRELGYGVRVYQSAKCKSDHRIIGELEFRRITANSKGEAIKKVKELMMDSLGIIVAVLKPKVDVYKEKGEWWPE